MLTVIMKDQANSFFNKQNLNFVLFVFVKQKNFMFTHT